MVKLSLSLAAIVAMVATAVSAAPCSQMSMNRNSFHRKLDQCIPEVDFKEYQPFLLKSSDLNSIVSRFRDFDVLVGGVDGNKMFDQLTMCVVSQDAPCDTDIPSDCIYDDMDYRFRVEGPIKGYLTTFGDHIKVVPDFDDASSLNFYKEKGWGLRIAEIQPDGSRLVFATEEKGFPLFLEKPAQDTKRQWFQLIDPDGL
ncbi:hypothetical protein BGW38_003287 [Lunasporangiospora selenospora]|uniref:Uncharacterized protein n=1 Tax=Lunasporangiospora selenospora TaxID=979761 RepID=A0A9P6FRQ2_9FUNG|nr:hypothetical protein BGW38_003287 [Lunasporangiospora selenospora]